MKMPKLFARRFRKRPTPPPKAYQTQLKATATSAAPRREAIDDYDAPEPTTSLSTAFIIVLILHVVAVGGIYIFNHIKASRPHVPEPIASTSTKPASKPAHPAAKTAPPKTAPVSTPQKPAPAPAEKSVAAAKPTMLPSGARIHRVLPNENLTKIATLYSLTVADLEDANGLPRNAVLQVDQVLNIPGQKNVVKQPAAAPPLPEPVPRRVPEPTLAKFTPTTTAKPAPIVAPVAAKAAPVKAAGKSYTVDKGDTATYIAKKFNVSIADLLKLNGISDPKKLQPGQTLKVPVKTN